MAQQIRTPFSGWSTPLAEIPDEVFARAMLGEGAAIDPTSNELRAPCDGEVTSIAAASHAIALRAPGGAEILVHVGIDTVALGGAGFEVLTRKGKRVHAGDVLLRFDLDRVARRARSLVTPVIVTNSDRFRIVRAAVGRELAAGDVLFEVEEQSAAVAGESADAAPVVSEALVVAHAHGIHARPAGLIARVAKSLPWKMEVRARGRRANPQSAVALMSLGVRGGDELVIVGFEAGAAAGIAEIARVVRELDAQPAHAPASPHPSNSPPRHSLSAPNAPVAVPAGCVRGVIANRGFALGKAAWLDEADIEVPEAGSGAATEAAAFGRAQSVVRDRIATRAGGAAPDLHGILRAHLELLDDPQLVESALEAIRVGKSAGFAWRAAIAASVAELNATGDPRLMERAMDFADLERQVLAELTGTRERRPDIAAGSILVARDLTPSQLVDIDASRLAGIALMAGGPTSHVAILAGTLGIPMLVSLGPSLREIRDGAELVLDADAGLLNAQPDAAALAAARARLESVRARAARERAAAADLCHLASGERIEVFANLAGTEADARRAVEQGAEGCGLLRTEFLFLERTTAPDEIEQRTRYQQVADLMGGRPLVIRTLDIGGDKPIPYLPLPAEENPALGLRGIRTSLWRPELLDVQLRALLGVEPAVRILVPMITEYGEIELVRQRLHALAAELGVPVPQLGAMIETPAAAMLADQIAKGVDFLSIGTNDLAQYGLAMDRGHAELAARIDGVHPAVLRLVEATTRGAAVHSRPVAVCGGLASDPDAVPLLLGLGVTELSVVPGQIARLKAYLRTLTLDDCCRLAERALQMDNAAEVRRLARELEVR
ncbi:MAG TPA: phosphoenolpyruvate--protein phosphotransferase [Steroidobacteraceae bacterium]|nr:phosphoenolpyruvate--protein phosphotransferase [Steroidobacteraceae bacterium]